MSAETKVMVHVLKSYHDIIEVSAVSLSEAREIAEKLPHVIAILDVHYPYEKTD